MSYREVEHHREALAATHYDRTIQKQQAQLRRALTGDIVMRRDHMSQQATRQGLLRNFLSMFEEPSDRTARSAIQGWSVFTHDIKKHSGMHRHQGGLVIYVVSGRGHTIVEGERVDWEAGDVILLPIIPGGVAHQHFNDEDDDGTPVQWVAFVYRPMNDAIGSYMEQITEVGDNRH